MPDSTSRVLTFINVSSSDCLLTRQPLCAGDNAGFSPVGPQRLLRIILSRETERLPVLRGDGDAGWALDWALDWLCVGGCTDGDPA